MAGPSWKRISAFLSKELRKDLEFRTGAAWTRMESAWRRGAGESLSGHCWPAAYQQGRLVIHAESSAWGGVLRRKKQRLLTELRRYEPFAEIDRIEIKIRPTNDLRDPYRTLRPASEKKSLDEATAKLIKGMADGIRDSKLRAALTRLSNNQRKPRGGVDRD